MTEDSASIFAHLRPYDASMEDNLTMYDHLPYDRDVDLCGPQNIKLETGNVIKYYHCALSKESFPVDNRDKEFAKRLREYQEPPAPVDDVLEMKMEQLNSLPSDEDILGDLARETDFQL